MAPQTGPAPKSGDKRSERENGDVLSAEERFEYYYDGRRDAQKGLPSMKWMGLNWPEEGRQAYQRGWDEFHHPKETK